MSPDAFQTACLALPGATLSVQWGDEHVFKVGGKMFAVYGPGDAQGGPRYSFKVSDMAFELLIDHGLATPAPYLARARWVRLAGPDALSDKELCAYLREAHALVAAKLTRAQRRALGLPVG